MVIDSSVLIAILLDEPEAESYRKLLAETEKIYLSAISFVESAMVIEHKSAEQGAKKFDELLKIIAPTIIAFDEQQAKLARIAWQQYGKGRHPAKLTMVIVAVTQRLNILISRYYSKAMIFHKQILRSHSVLRYSKKCRVG